MLKGDNFELIDGRTFEMRSDILKEIIGEISHKKCIVTTVIGPQNTGKSALMNSCFGTQFSSKIQNFTRGL